jgi:hypothetical protein
MKKESWMSEAGYASGVLETRRHITAKRNPRNWKGRLIFGATMMVLLGASLAAYALSIKWGAAAFEHLTASVPTTSTGAASASIK